MRRFKQLLKPAIVINVLVCTILGFGLGYTVESGFPWLNLVLTLAGVTLLSAGSLSLNSTQEWRRDILMPRTAQRPIPTGALTVAQGYAFGGSCVLMGLGILYQVKPVTGLIGALTVILYNLLYTLYWKRQWAFAAVPGAIPGALPVVLGFSAASDHIFSTECLYGFLIVFLWQMPHFWALAIRYKDDYAQGGFPVLPLKIGVERTLFHIGLYVFAYVGVAMMSPLFVEARWLYLFLVVPFCLKVVWEFYQFHKAGAQTRWLRFFLWVNFSMLAFLIAPVLDKFSLLIEHF